MQIEQIGIGSFRSLYSVSLSPRHFTVLVGANNAGKTNVAEAIDFLSDVHRHGLELAVSRKGGFDNVAQRRMRRTKKPLSFSVEVSASLSEFMSLRMAGRS